jgi:hypothetical protein
MIDSTLPQEDATVPGDAGESDAKEADREEAAVACPHDAQDEHDEESSRTCE